MIGFLCVLCVLCVSALDLSSFCDQTNETPHLPHQRPAPGLRVRLRRRVPRDARRPMRPRTSNGRTTSSIARACRASRRNGGITCRAAPGSSPSATCRPTWCSAPTCLSEAPGGMTRLAAHRRRVDRPHAPARLRVRGQDLPRLRRRHHHQRALGSGVRVLGRSFKYHRPRGVLSLANHDVNALLEDGTLAQPARRRDAACSRHAPDRRSTPSAALDARPCASARPASRRFLPVGFYYKAFHRPKWMFPHWERVIRKLSGLGKPDFDAPRVRTPKRYDLLRRAGDRRRTFRHVGRAGGRTRRREGHARGRERAHRRQPDLRTRRLTSTGHEHCCASSQRKLEHSAQRSRCAPAPSPRLLRRPLGCPGRREPNDQGARRQHHRRDRRHASNRRYSATTICPA